MKFCKKCNTEKAPELFSAHKTTKNKLQNVCKACINENSALYYVANKDKCSAYAKGWKAVNKDKVNLSTAMRRKRVQGRKIPWANSFFIAEAYRLAKLRTDMFGFKWHVDHIYPLRGKTVSGLHVETNMQVIPASVNFKKSYYSVEEISLGGY